MRAGISVKKIIKISSVVLVCIWAALHLICIAAKLTYSPPEGYDSIDAAWDRLAYSMLAMLALGGVICSGLQSVGVFFRFGKDAGTDKGLKTAALASSAIAAALFHLSVFLLFTIDSDWVLFVFTLTAVASAASFILLMILGIKKLVQKSLARQERNGNNYYG